MYTWRERLCKPKLVASRVRDVGVARIVGDTSECNPQYSLFCLFTRLNHGLRQCRIPILLGVVLVREPQAMAKQKSQLPWQVQLAQSMIKDDLSMIAAVTRLGLELSNQDCDELSRDEEFQRLLRAERNRYYRDLAVDPSRDKRTAVGMMLSAIQKLLDEGEWDKAVEGITKLAKLEGWLAPDGQVSIFANLSAKDLEEVRKRLQEANERQDRSSTPRTPDSFLN